MASKAQIANFVAQITPVAQQIGAQYGIDPSVIVAQAGLETGYGQSAPGNNYFGIKGNGQIQTTKEQGANGLYTTKQGFRAYPSLEASVADWANLVSKNYPGVVGASPEDAFAALKAGGYATDNNYASKLKAALTTTRDAGTGPIPPMNIPEVGSAYADTSVPTPGNLSAVGRALQASTPPTYQDSAMPSGAGEQLAFNPQQYASSPVLGDDGQLYRQSGSVPPMDAGFNPATGQVQPFANDPNILAAMGSGSTQSVPQSPGFASQSQPYYPSHVPSGPGIGQQSQPYTPSASAALPAAGASGAAGGLASLSSPAAVPLASLQAKQGGVNIGQSHGLNAMPVSPLPAPAGYYDRPTPSAAPSQTVKTANGNTYTVGQIFTTPNGTYKVGVDANGQATFNKAETLPTGGMVGGMIGNALVNAGGQAAQAAPAAISGALSGLGGLVSGLFGGNSTPSHTGVAIPSTAGPPQTYGPAGQSYSSTPANAPYGGPYNEIDAKANSGPSWTDLMSPSAGSSGSSWLDQIASGGSNTVDPSLYTPQPAAPTYQQVINPAYTAWMNNQSPSPFTNPGVQGLSPDDRDSPDGIARAVPGLTSSAFATKAPPKYVTVRQPAPAVTPRVGLAAMPVANVSPIVKGPAPGSYATPNINDPIARAEGTTVAPSNTNGGGQMVGAINTATAPPAVLRNLQAGGYI